MYKLIHETSIDWFLTHVIMGLMVTTETGRQNGECMFKGQAYKMSAHNGHALVVCFAGQMTSGARPMYVQCSGE